MEHQNLGAQIVNDLAQALEVRVDRQRHLERGPGLVQKSVPKANLAKAGDRSEMARLELERPLQVGQAFGVALFDEGQGGALVPGFGPIRVLLDQEVEKPARLVE